MKNIVVCCLIFVATNVYSQRSEWKWVSEIKDVCCKVTKQGDDLWILQDIKNDSKRYIAKNLDDVLKQDGLVVKLSAKVAEIPPHIRMAGTPIFILRLSVTNTMKKKFKLQKKKWEYRAPK